MSKLIQGLPMIDNLVNSLGFLKTDELSSQGIPMTNNLVNTWDLLMTDDLINLGAFDDK